MGQMCLLPDDIIVFGSSFELAVHNLKIVLIGLDLPI
jgi:hypothetical protein